MSLSGLKEIKEIRVIKTNGEILVYKGKSINTLKNQLNKFLQPPPPPTNIVKKKIVYVDEDEEEEYEDTEILQSTDLSTMSLSTSSENRNDRNTGRSSTKKKEVPIQKKVQNSANRVMSSPSNSLNLDYSDLMGGSISSNAEAMKQQALSKLQF
jgi:hypothetical protein